MSTLTYPTDEARPGSLSSVCEKYQHLMSWLIYEGNLEKTDYLEIGRPYRFRKQQTRFN